MCIGQWLKGVESSLSLGPDVAFNEDGSRARGGNAPENLALVRRNENETFVGELG